MNRLQRGVVVAGLAASTVLAAGPAAVAAPTHEPVSLQDVATRAGRLTALVDGVDPRADRVHLSVAGKPVDAQVTPVVSGSHRNAVLVIDASSSMAGARLASARQAAGAFLSAVPADVRVGLVTFADTARLVVAPTTDRARVRAELAGVRAGGATAVYDALDTALAAAPRGELFVLTDGTDTVSSQRLNGVLQKLNRSAATVDVVGLQGAKERAAAGVQRRIAAAGHGRAYTTVSSSQAVDRFQQVRIRARVPDGVSGPAQVQVRVDGPSGSASNSTVATVAPAPGTAPTAAQSSSAQPSSVQSAPAGTASGSGRIALLIGLGAAFASLLLLALLAVGGPREAAGRRRMRGLVSRYSKRPAEQERPREDRSRLRESAIARTALDLAGRVAARRGLGERLARKLDSARVALQPNEWLLLCAGIVLVTTAAFTLLTGSLLIGLLIGAVTGAGGPQVFLRIKVTRRQAAFSSDLPDALQLMAGGLSSGYSLPQAIDSVVRLGEGPVAEEFGRALAHVRLGTPVETALDDVADRVESVDFRWVVMAIRIQRQVGGNLSEVLTQVADTLRERAWLRRHVRGLSAEGRLSGYVLTGLPVLVALYMYLVRRSYIAALYTQPLGLAMIAMAVFLLGIGAVTMRKLAQVEL